MSMAEAQIEKQDFRTCNVEFSASLEGANMADLSALSYRLKECRTSIVRPQTYVG